MALMIEAGCPECGHDGPHVEIPGARSEGGRMTDVECSECAIEFCVDIVPDADADPADVHPAIPQ